MYENIIAGYVMNKQLQAFLPKKLRQQEFQQLEDLLKFQTNQCGCAAERKRTSWPARARLAVLQDITGFAPHHGTPPHT